VRAAAGSSSEIVFVSYQEAYQEGFEDMARRVPDVTKLERMTDFRPRIPLSTIIGDVLADQDRKLRVEGRPPAVSPTGNGVPEGLRGRDLTRATA